MQWFHAKIEVKEKLITGYTRTTLCNVEPFKASDMLPEFVLIQGPFKTKKAAMASFRKGV
jgi:hypothetical protein